jgi:hypothetical protein
MEVPEFGSRAWIEQALFAILTQAREQATKFYETKARESPDASVDPEFGTIEIEPSYSRPWAWHDPVADKMMAEFLRSEGIPADQTIRYR